MNESFLGDFGPQMKFDDGAVGPNYAKMSEQELVRETINASVGDWIEKYHPRDSNSNLRVNNPNDTKQLENWRSGVIGRIEHQLKGSGFGGLSDNELSHIIIGALHDYFKEDPWYNLYLLNILGGSK